MKLTTMLKINKPLTQLKINNIQANSTLAVQKHNNQLAHSFLMAHNLNNQILIINKVTIKTIDTLTNKCIHNNQVVNSTLTVHNHNNQLDNSILMALVIHMDQKTNKSNLKIPLLLSGIFNFDDIYNQMERMTGIGPA